MRRLPILVFLAALVAPVTVLAGHTEAETAFLAADYETALKETQPLAEAGDPRSQYLLGVMYSQGKGVPRDEEQTIRWYNAAARQDHADAQFNLGFLYYAKARYEDAAPWLLNAAERGTSMAEYLVGAMYAAGKGLPQDDPRAYWWTLKAADKGVAPAQFNAGLMCNARIPEGMCSHAEAYKWFRMLADQGYPAAAQNIERLRGAMTPEEIAEGEHLAGQWTPKPE